jgi:AraC-like DNA-binding protein
LERKSITVHLLQFRQASASLREFVRAYAQRDLDAPPQPFTEFCPARLEQDLEFQFGPAFEVLRPDRQTMLAPEIAIVGAYTSGRAEIRFYDRSETFGVFFQPTGFSRLMGIPPRDLSNMAFEATSVVGSSIRQLWQRLAEARSFGARVRIVENFLRARAAVRNTRRAPAVMSGAADFILATGGSVRISDLAQHHDLSIRQFERKFLNEIGVPPKLYARVARFQTALDLKIAAPRRSWLEIAHDIHYHDQMHMIHDFKELAGDTPSRVFPGIGDLRPTALAAHTRGEIGRVTVSIASPNIQST